jgi:GNAT superfamily N-acetyltransferase
VDRAVEAASRLALAAAARGQAAEGLVREHLTAGALALLAGDQGGRRADDVVAVEWFAVSPSPRRAGVGALIYFWERERAGRGETKEETRSTVSFRSLVERNHEVGGVDLSPVDFTRFDRVSTGM